MLVNDRRLAGQGFKRQVPIGPHIADLVSFPLRIVIDIVPSGESDEAAAARAARHAWLADRGYRVIETAAADIEADVMAVIAKLAVELNDAAGNRDAPDE
jgi:tRNA/rRNA methyltransferase